MTDSSNLDYDYALVTFMCATLDDIEDQRIAQENRFRMLTRDVEDSDGEMRGMGIAEDHSDVAVFKMMIDSLDNTEQHVIKMLERHVKVHPMGPWIMAQQGVGLKQAGRLIGAIGDPYWNTLHDRPRTVAELWSYCGLAPGQRRKQGVVDKWSADAKSRVWLITTSIVKQLRGTCKTVNEDETVTVEHIDGCECSPWRVQYDARKAATVGRLHATDCVRCGPSGHPAKTGSPWSDAHRHADAMRYVGKRILREMWRESRRLHTAADADTEKAAA